jgi:cyclopropane fatty-acyl-phospholipid synthase-like methyltransferase
VHLLVKLWQTVPEQIRFPMLRVVQRNKPVYRWLMFRHADLKDRSNSERAHLPPAEMRYRVGGSPDADEFVAIGKACANDIQAALRKVGREFASFDRILDFGCGCGRTMVHVRELAPQARIEGTDIDANAIQWCKENLEFASFSLSKETPPIGYEADSFDLIYVISVFTHLDEDYQFRWLEELRRIARPGGIIVATVNGAKNGQGFFFERSYEEGLFPAWYQNTYHSRDYVFENFGKYFKVLEHLPKSMNSHQDVVVLEKSGE